MKLRPQDHSRHAWRIDEIAPDFRLLDAWALPVEGSEGEFKSFYECFRELEANEAGASSMSRALFRLRTTLGRWFGWDKWLNTLPIPGCSEVSLRERLPSDLVPMSATPGTGAFTFVPVYRTEREVALEISNSTVHAVMHLGWIPTQGDRFTAQMGVYVKTRGWLGPLYMAAIAPFRHGIVYPAMVRRIGKRWAARA